MCVLEICRQHSHSREFIRCFGFIRNNSTIFTITLAQAKGNIQQHKRIFFSSWTCCPFRFNMKYSYFWYQSYDCVFNLVTLIIGFQFLLFKACVIIYSHSCLIAILGNSIDGCFLFVKYFAWFINQAKKGWISSFISKWVCL